VVAQDQDARFDGAIDEFDGTGLKGGAGELERGGSRHGNKRVGGEWIQGLKKSLNLPYQG
jgi:hypothetical protein